jgi:2-polyprenyl-3-methyl-5-hydroxy-6-metoxy-1,4-benzoquinol methylase
MQSAMSYVSDIFDFIVANVPVPACVLDVGCGNGALAKMLVDSGFDVFAVDAHDDAVAKSRALGIQVVQCDFLDCEDKIPKREHGFDCIFFGRSLHHINHPLSEAMAMCDKLLGPDGVIIVDDFDIEAVDKDEAEWLFNLQAVLLSVNAITKHTGFGHDEKTTESPFERWRHNHLYEHKLATGKEMKEPIASRFVIESEQHLPYLYRYIVDNVTDHLLLNRPLIAATTSSWEASRHMKRDKPPVGFRLVARKP